MRAVLSTVIALSLAVAMQAQETKVKEKTKTKVDDGRKVTLTGCLQASPEGGYELTGFTPVAGVEPGAAALMLRTEDSSTLDLQNHVGHRVELTGFVPKHGHDDVDVNTRTKTKVESKGQPDMKSKSKSKAEVEGEGHSFLLVTSLRHIAATCS